MCEKQQEGFSLTELVVALAVLGIVMSIAAPNFSSAMQNARLSSSYNDMVGALQLARSEAVKRNSPVAVCARATDTTCGTNWNNGALIFADDGLNANNVDAGEEMIRVLPEAQSGTLISALGSSTSTGSFIQRTNIRFLPSGSSSWRGGGAIKFCNGTSDDHMRVMLINLGGNIHRARADQQGDVVTQWGATLSC